MSAEVRLAVPDDALAVERTIRLSEDVQRVGIDIPKAIREAIEKAEHSWVLRAEGEVICIWGVERESLLSGDGYIWMVTTKGVEDHVFLFVRTAQVFLKEVFQHYDRLWGVVDARFDRSIRWLKWTGFTVGSRNEHGFCRFQRTK